MKPYSSGKGLGPREREALGYERDTPVSLLDAFDEPPRRPVDGHHGRAVAMPERIVGRLIQRLREVRSVKVEQSYADRVNAALQYAEEAAHWTPCTTSRTSAAYGSPLWAPSPRAVRT